MELLSFRQLAIVDDLLRQIRKAILDLQEWNRDIQDADDWLTSSDGMKTLAASCMLIEAIGEGYRNIDERTSGQLLAHRPEIPWRQVIGMRNRIAHGYFDINAEFVWDIIQNDLAPLLYATEFFLDNLYSIIPADDSGK